MRNLPAIEPALNTRKQEDSPDMSIKIMTKVWDHSEMKGSALLLLLAIADHADDEGFAFPKTETLANKIRMSERQVKRLRQILYESGELEYIKGGNGPGDRLVVRVTTCPKGDTQDTHNNAKGDTYDTHKGDKSGQIRVTQLSPEPSIEPSIEPSLIPATPDAKDDSLQSKVFDVLESQYLTVNPLMVQTHTELAERYGFDAFLRGWEYCKPGARHKASYLEKVILSHMTDDETPDELKAKEAPQRIWCKHSTDFNASGWITVEGDRIKYEAKDSTTYTTQHPQWLKKVQAGEINDNLLGLFYTRGKAA